ncbi:MAG: hypothetical protein KBD26_00840 [Candidatus Pacebacteria bacterium]|nr:hypothetical protein [Candidatus Paceibacterota bacterium]MBP9772357.1 hypothetical protein [Candidatus Paceibacterota bacterium]QQR76801.1 MAG: hypothetical protein IPJ63_00840 [Candidatus Nomurabacteria bacterium]
MTFKQKAGMGAGIVFGIIVFLYAIFRLHDLIFGINIKVEGIENGMVVTDPNIQIDGNAKRASFVTLNGNEVFISKEGDFSEPIVLLPGENVVSLYVKDKFGKDTTEIYKVVYLVSNQ